MPVLGPVDRTGGDDGRAAPGRSWFTTSFAVSSSSAAPPPTRSGAIASTRYLKHGTTTLFAAFEVATGKVTGAHKKRRRRKEFLAFMDEVVATYPKTRLEVILDNLNTHKKNEEWLARHPLVTFHYTPTRASWLNQVEGWFSILQGQSLTGASFTSVEQLKKHIDAFIESYNEDAEPFVWTKSKVHQRRVKGRRLSNL